MPRPPFIFSHLPLSTQQPNSTSMASSSASTGPLTTPLTQLLKIRHPILLAGMAHTATAPLAAAVSSAGGLGVIGGLGYTPATLREMIQELKGALASPDLPFGVDLALPQVGGNARKTNHDYTHGQLEQLVDVIIEEGTRLFVSAVGVPPKSVVDRLHAAGIVVMNMVGHPNHAHKAFAVGVDAVCAQGGEGGGHTGAIPQNLLVPAVADVAAQYKPALLGGQTGIVVAAGGVYDGRGLAGALVQGASGVWVGTRFLASDEAACSNMHKQAVVSSGWDDTVRTVIFTGRPLRVKRTPYIDDWEANRQAEITELCDKGVIPASKDADDETKELEHPYLMGQVAGAINDIKPARQIVQDMVKEAVQQLNRGSSFVGSSSHL